MAFHTIPFLLGFLPLVIGGYALAARFGNDWAKLWLIAASLLFYGIGAGRYLPLLLFSVGGNLLLLQAMARSRDRSRLAAWGAGANLVLLAWFKFGVPELWPEASLPLGISFYTFTQIGALLAAIDPVDRPVRAIDQALFCLFFPVLIAGPILNAGEVLTDFQRFGRWRLSARDLATGAGFFIIGLLKKTVLADPLGPMVAGGFVHPGGADFWAAWQAATAWSLELYFDFSGYSDMAIGLAWMVGIHIPDNFEQPYRAHSVIQYWQRWHMSLTRFLMAHVHAPITLWVLRRRRRLGLPIDQAAQMTSSGFVAMIASPLVVTMLLAGVWHGPVLTYGVFGLMHAGFLAINHAWRLWKAPRLPAIVSVALTYGAILAGGVVFRAASLADAAELLGAMAGGHGIALPHPDLRWALGMLWLLALYAIVWFAPTTRQFMCDGNRWCWQPTPRWAMAMGCIAALGLLAAGGTQEFVYFGF